MKWKILTLLFFTYLLSSCSYNPFVENNHLTGEPLAGVAGAGVGVAAAGALNAPKPVLGIVGITGGAIGYYVTTLRYDAGGIYAAGGQVYTLGSNVGIYIPTDKLFEPNTSELLPQASPALDSVLKVLDRYPDNNILISGNTSGFYRGRWEQKLSEQRAQKISAYLWAQGFSVYRGTSMKTRKLNFVGYGDYFPVANKDSNDSLRENSYIQITSYPDSTDLHLDKKHVVMRNIGALTEDTSGSDDDKNACGDGKIESCFKN